MRTLIGAIVAIIVGVGVATGVTVAVSSTSAPDKNVNFDNARTPDPWNDVPDYGSR